MKLLKRAPSVGYVDSHLWVPKSIVNEEGVKSALTFELHDKEEIRYIVLYEETDSHLIVPRSMWDPETFNIPFIDCRPQTYKRTNIKSKIKLDHKRGPNGSIIPTGKTTQKDSLAALLLSKGGTLQLKCGDGKTVVALELATKLQVPTLVAVDNTHLLHQWMEAVNDLLIVPGGVGLIQSQTRDWNKSFVLATYHTLANWSDTMPEEVRRHFGLVIWDEGHHVSAPVFSKSAYLFYGMRLALTATPFRSDGAHVICQYHVGPVIFKNVKQENPPAIYFKWTGLSLDTEDVSVGRKVNDINGDLHLGKLAGHFGKWRKRLTEAVLPEVQAAINAGRKVLVLSNSVDEVINLMTLWTVGDKDAFLYSDIPYPTKEEIGVEHDPRPMNKKELVRTTRLIREIQKNLSINTSLSKTKRKTFFNKINELKIRLEQHTIHKKLESVFKKRQREFLKELLLQPSTAGLFTYGVDPVLRVKMLKERKVIFAIMKYGKEGLDDKDLDTIIMCEPVSDKNIIQQIMGRPRDKKNATLTVLEDNVGPLLAQCMKFRKHLRNWPVDEGGPFKYDLLGHPATFRRRSWRQTNPPMLR